ncbi:MAG: acylneuraminate cytidylyltransferase family protein [Hyphomicrobium sp.]
MSEPGLGPVTSRVLVIVPARGGSKRLPGKNLRKLGRTTLLAHTAAFLTDEGYLEDAILSTDDEAIAEEGRRCGLSVPFMRPAELAQDATDTASVVIDVIEKLRKPGRLDAEYVAVAQPTSPFRRRGLLRDAVARLDLQREINSVIAMKPLHVSERFVFAAAGGGHLCRLGDGARSVLVPCGSIYVARTPVFLASRCLYAEPISAIEVTAREAIDVDTEEDLQMALYFADRLPAH